MSVWIFRAFVAVDTRNCCTRFAIVVAVAVADFVLVLDVVVVDVAALVSSCLYYVFHLLCPSRYLSLSFSLALSHSWLIIVDVVVVVVAGIWI